MEQIRNLFNQELVNLFLLQEFWTLKNIERKF